MVCKGNFVQSGGQCGLTDGFHVGQAVAGKLGV